MVVYRQRKQDAATRAILLFLLIIAMLFNYQGFVAVAANDTDFKDKIIRVGFPNQKGLTEISATGEYSGYTYEYLQQIAQYTGWEYEFVQVQGTLDESVRTMMDMLENDELDLMGATLYEEGTEQRYDYAGHSYGTAETVLEVLYESTADITGVQLMQTLRVAILKNAPTRQNELMEYCDMNRITPELVYCDTREDQVRALEEGRADAMLSVNLLPVEGLRTIARFAPRPFYFVTTKGNTELVREINSAIQSINQTDPYYADTLSRKYFEPKQGQIYFSAKEFALLSQKNTLKVAVELNKPPLHQMDAQGNPMGVAVDLMRWVEQKTGLQFEFVIAPTQQEVMRMAREHEVDLAIGIPHDHEIASENNMAISYPYLSTPYVLVTRSGVSANNLEGKRYALADNVFYTGESKQVPVHSYSTLEQCLKALLQGKADYTYANSYQAQYYINQPEYATLQTVTVAGGEPYRGSIGVVKPVNRELLGIINKALTCLSEQEMQEIIFKNTSIVPTVSLLYFVKQNPGGVLLAVASTLCLIIALLVISLRSYIKMNHQVELQLKKHLQVYEIASEIFFEYDHSTHVLTVWTSENGRKTPDKMTAQVHNLLQENAQEGESEKVQKALLLETITSGRDGSTDLLLRLADDEMHWMRIAMKTVWDKNGRAVCVVGKFSDIDQMQQERAQLVEQAQMDGLTHVYNIMTCQKLIMERLAALKEDDSGALLVIDIDHFKEVNDNHGHLAGDHALTRLGSLLNRSFRENDIVGRLGGDEFIVYMNNIKGAGVVRKKCAALCKSSHLELSETDQSISISIGAAMVEQGVSYNALYQTADHALYDAKQRGRDQFVIAEQISKEC